MTNHTPRRLTSTEKKRIEALMYEAKDRKRRTTVQNSIPYQDMTYDGICCLWDSKYSMTLEIGDINYRLLSENDKQSVYTVWKNFWNFFDPSIHIELTCITQKAKKVRVPMIPQFGENHAAVRGEFQDILTRKILEGNSTINQKYITLTVTAESTPDAEMKFHSIIEGITNILHPLGLKIQVLTGYERLNLFYDILHRNNDEFIFSWDWLQNAGLTTKDYIAPSSFHFGDSRTFKIEDKIGAVSFLQILASTLHDTILEDMLQKNSQLLLSLHADSISRADAIKTLKRTVTDLDKMKLEEQKRASRAGYDTNILPSDLAVYRTDAKKLLSELTGSNENLFLFTLLVVHIADTSSELESQIQKTNGILKTHNCRLVRLDYRQEDGFMSALPFGINEIPIQRKLTTSGMAIFIPFRTSELTDDMNAVYYGANAISRKVILCDRKKLKNPNGLILGTPGSGKSFAAKREIMNVFLTTQDEIIITEPESEYASLVKALDGQVISLSPVGTQYINPMDIAKGAADEDIISIKCDFILSLCELMIGSETGLQPVEKTVVSRAVKNVYTAFLKEDKQPILEDLYHEILKQPEPEAARIAAALELYVSGSLNIFNHRTNVKLENRLVCFDIKNLGKQLKKLGMLMIQEFVWNRLSANREKHVTTRYYMDEMHILLKEKQTAAYTAEMWKRFRKWGGIPTGLTQNCKDFLTSEEAHNILENSDFILLLNQAAGDREILAKKLNLSDEQLSYITQSNAGQGLLIYGSTVLPFVDTFPKDSMLYRLMTTRPEEMEGSHDE